MNRLRFTPRARKDLADIGCHIAKDDPKRARTFVAELRAKAEQAAERPLSFRSRDDIRAGLRSALHGRYMLLFRSIEADVLIVRVVHGAQELGSLDYD